MLLRGRRMSGDSCCRRVQLWANGQVALAFSSSDVVGAASVPFAFNAPTLRVEQICDVTAFSTRSTEIPDREVMARLPEQPPDPSRLAAAFQNFGLPERLD